MPIIGFSPVDANSSVTLIGDLLAYPVVVSFDGQLLTRDEFSRVGNSLTNWHERTHGQNLEIIYFTRDAQLNLSGGSSRRSGASGGCGTAERVRMIINNHWRRATLTQNRPTATNINNTKTEWRSRVLRDTNNIEPLVICGTLPDAELFSGLALARHTISALGTMQLELIDGDDCSGAVVYDSGSLYPALIKPLGEYVFGIDPWGMGEDSSIDPVFAHFFSPFAAKSFRLTLTDPLNPAGFFDIGQIFLGDTLTLDNNFSYGFSIAWLNAQEYLRTEGGTLLTIGNNQQWREINLPFDFLSDADRERLARQQRMQPGQSIFLSMFPAGTDGEQREFALSCKFMPPEFTKPSGSHWQSTIKFMET